MPAMNITRKRTYKTVENKESIQISAFTCELTRVQKKSFFSIFTTLNVA